MSQRRIPRDPSSDDLTAMVEIDPSSLLAADIGSKQEERRNHHEDDHRHTRAHVAKPRSDEVLNEQRSNDPVESSWSPAVAPGNVRVKVSSEIEDMDAEMDQARLLFSLQAVGDQAQQQLPPVNQQNHRDALAECSRLTATGGNATDASNLPLHLPLSAAADSQLESDRLRQVVRRELQSQPHVQAEVMEPPRSCWPKILVALLIAIIILLAVGLLVVLLRQNKPLPTPVNDGDPFPEDSSTAPTPSMNLSTDPLSEMPTLSSRSLDIRNYINNITMSSRAIVFPLPTDTEPTTEELALDWLINADPLYLTVEEDNVRLTQRFALRTLWFGTNGPEWNNKNGWLDDSDECKWHGILCEQKLVVAIGFTGVLLNNNLMGSIPADLALLTTCTIVNLGQNPRLGGTIPLSLSTMTRITSLVIDGYEDIEGSFCSPPVVASFLCI